MRRKPARAVNWNARGSAHAAANEAIPDRRPPAAGIRWRSCIGCWRADTASSIVCHLDHCLRGRSSSADARFVGRLAQANSLTFETAAVDVRKLAAETKQSIEAAARAARYAFFAAVARRRRCRTIFSRASRDDLVETYLINLFRGAGLQGQRSFVPSATQQIAAWSLPSSDPLSRLARRDRRLHQHHRLRFREDASNEQLDALRNRVRHRIIPMLEKEFGRDIRKTVRRAASIAADEDAF
jgi:tRNA(Ile)-lysidine synthase